jgi:glycosyltransferase involved in cell wall biosynthesis
MATTLLRRRFQTRLAAVTATNRRAALARRLETQRRDGMLLTIWALLRHRGGARSLQTIRYLIGTYGIWITLRLISNHLRQADASVDLDSGPIARLVESDVISRRSVARFSANCVLIGSLDLPQCRKYRVIQKQEMMECAAGTKMTISHYDDVYRWRTQLQTADKVILYRIPDIRRFQEIMIEARRLGLTVCYDMDDAVFDLETVKSNPNLTYLSPNIQKALFRDAVVFSDGMRQCDIITVSTPGLQRLVKQRFREIPCYIIPNGVDAETIHYGSVAKRQASVTRPKPFTILMASGSLAHAADTNVAIDGIQLFLERCPEAQIITIGHFDAGNTVLNTEVLKNFSVLPYSEYLRVVATADCVLVPLAESAFNHCKSIARLIDATEVGVPVVASPVGEYSEPVLVSAFFPARSASEWCNALETISASRREANLVLGAATEQVRAPRLLDSIWRDLDPQLHAFFGGHTPRTSLPLREAKAQAV